MIRLKDGLTCGAARVRLSPDRTLPRAAEDKSEVYYEREDRGHQEHTRVRPPEREVERHRPPPAQPRLWLRNSCLWRVTN